MPITRECFMSKTLDNQLFDIAEVLSDSSGYPIPSRPCFNEMTIDYQLYNLWRAWGGGATVLLEGLLAFYKLSDLTDSSGNGNTLTNTGGVTFGPGKIGDAAVFNGTNDLSVAPFNAGTTFSFGCWMNTPALNDYDIILQQFAGAGFYTMADGSMEFGDISTWNAASAAGVLTINTWHHIVLVSNAGSGTLYVDGVVVATDNINTLDLIDATDRPFGINGEPISGASPVGKLIDAVGIWNRALSNAEIALLYNNGNGIELP